MYIYFPSKFNSIASIPGCDSIIQQILSSNMSRVLGLSVCLSTGLDWDKWKEVVGWPGPGLPLCCSIVTNDELYWKDKWLDESSASSRSWHSDTAWCESIQGVLHTLRSEQKYLRPNDFHKEFMINFTTFNLFLFL